MNCPRWLLLLPPLMLSSSSLLAQVPTPPPLSVSSYENPDPARYLFEDQIRPGMRGYGLTVIHGGEIQRFDFSVIDVVENFGPNRNVILVRCSGLGLEHSGIIAGMSGSPLYIDGKMIGAIAYGWSLAKDPVGGVQPIRQMLNIPCGPPAGAAIQTAQAGSPSIPLHSSGAREILQNPFWKTRWMARPGYQRLMASLEGSLPIAAPRAPLAANLVPLAAPLSVSQADPQVLELLGASLGDSNLVPMSSGSSGAASSRLLGGLASLEKLTLAPGSALAVPLLQGDLNMAAIGTVTEVRDGKVWGFGHPFLSDAPEGLPIASGYIFHVMANLQTSFKLGCSMQHEGLLVADAQTGIVGTLGGKARRVPIQVDVREPESTNSRLYGYELFPHPKMAPFLAGTAVMSSLMGKRGLPRESVTRIVGTLNFDQASIPVDFHISGARPDLSPLVMPLALVGDNPYGKLELQSISLQAQTVLSDTSAGIKTIRVDQASVAPGESFSVWCELQPQRQATRWVQLTVPVPASAEEGEYTLSVGSASWMMQTENDLFPNRFNPQSMDELLAALKRMSAFDETQLYAKLLGKNTSVAADAGEWAKIPASRQNLLAGSSETLNVPDELQFQTPAGAVLPGGGTMLQVKVDRRAGETLQLQRNDSSLPKIKPPARKERRPLPAEAFDTD